MKLLPFLLFFGLSFAQQLTDNAILLTTPEEVAAIIDGANREILIATAELSSPQIAAALHRAMKDRNVKIYALIQEDTAYADTSYSNMLAASWGYVRLIRDLDEPFLVIDDGPDLRAVMGPLVGRVLRPDDPIGAIYTNDPVRVTSLRNAFVSTFNAAPLYEPALPERLAPSQP